MTYLKEKRGARGVWVILLVLALLALALTVIFGYYALGARTT